MGATESQCCTLLSAGSEKALIRKGLEGELRRHRTPPKDAPHLPSNSFEPEATLKPFFLEEEKVKPPKKLNEYSGSGRSGRSYQDECQSLASGSTADTMLRSTSSESANKRDRLPPSELPQGSPPSELPQGSPRKLRKLDMMRPPPIQLPRTPTKIKRAGSYIELKRGLSQNGYIEAAVKQPKTPARPKATFNRNSFRSLEESSPRRYSKAMKLTYP